MRAFQLLRNIPPPIDGVGYFNLRARRELFQICAHNGYCLNVQLAFYQPRLGGPIVENVGILGVLKAVLVQIEAGLNFLEETFAIQPTSLAWVTGLYLVDIHIIRRVLLPGGNYEARAIGISKGLIKELRAPIGWIDIGFMILSPLIAPAIARWHQLRALAFPKRARAARAGLIIEGGIVDYYHTKED